jgi:saccharopine dehydrogenase (NAD+, L-lysine-forming)
MKILVVGSGGVGAAVAPIAARRDFFEHIVFADIDERRAQRVVDRFGADGRYSYARVDASNAADVAAVAKANGCDAILNAVDPRFVPAVFQGAFDAGATYVDMAMSLSHPHPERPYEEVGEMLGEAQFAAAEDWEERGQLALVGCGTEPGFSDVAARYAADHLFREIDEIGVRDGANLQIRGHAFAPTFSIWTTIEECLNPPLIWEKSRGWYTTDPFSEPETFVFPEGIGAIECVNVEHEEVVLIPRWIACQRVTFKYGLGDEFIGVLRTLQMLGLDRTEAVKVGGLDVSPRDVVAAVLPDPAFMGEEMTGKTCAGTWVRGTGTDGEPLEVYIHHVVDTEETWANDGTQAVTWQAAVNPVIALELIADGTWSGAGVLGPEAFDAVPYLNLMNAYGSPWGQTQVTPHIG